MKIPLPKKYRVAIVGAAGHVGLPMALVLAHAGHTVYGIDINEKANAFIMSGQMPFLEEGGEAYLREALSAKNLEMTSDFSRIKKADVVVIVVGTPIDENLNPNLDIFTTALSSCRPYFKKNQLIILRSTVSPGITDRVRALIEDKSPFQVGRDLFLAFAPERILQGHAIHEIENLPQLIGAYEEKSFTQAEEFFKTFMKNRCFFLSPIEAELGKLMTNMARYVSFALANEYFLIAESFGANIHKIIDACTYDYPRLNLPRPGPNVGGPCLHKDGFYLLERMPFSDLISVAFKINEGMPAQILKKLEPLKNIRTVGILGMAFKANNDDTRNSLSFKLRRLLENAGYIVAGFDPYVPGFQDKKSLAHADIMILMSPHNEFRDLKGVLALSKRPNCLFMDIWGFWEEMKYEGASSIFSRSQALSRARARLSNFVRPKGAPLIPGRKSRTHSSESHLAS